MSTMVNNSFPNLLMGRGAAGDIGKVLKDAGFKHVFMVHGPYITKSIIEKVKKSIAEAGLKCTVYGKMEPEVPDYCVFEGVEEARRAGDVDVFLGVGGGSSMDGTKVINLLMHNEEPLKQYYVRNGGGAPQNPGLPIYLICTTAGTGSEVDAAAVVVDATEKNIKNPMGSRLCMYPTLSVIDPELYASLPRDYTASTGVDAFCHAYESYTGMRQLWSPLSDMYCINAMSTIIKYLPLAVNDLANIDYREKLALAATMSGMAVELARNHSGHALTHAIGSTTHATHGVCAASVEPFMAEYITKVRYDRNRDVLKLFGVEVPDGLSPEELGAKLREAMLEFFNSVGVLTLKDQGKTREQVMAASELAFSDFITHRFAAEGCDLEMKDIEEMLGKICTQAGL